jgi:dephospho-CoA kinase
MIIGLVGEKLAGKDTVANYLVDKHNASHFRFAHILDAILEELNLEISRKNEIDLGLGLRKIFGEHVLVNALEQRVRRSLSSYRVVNGIRMDELDEVKSWGAKIIYITAPLEIRFPRYQQRHEKIDDGEMDLEHFKLQEQEGPTEMKIPELGQTADFRIDNIGTIEELYGKVDGILKKLK